MLIKSISGGASGEGVGEGIALLLWKVLTVVFSDIGRIYV
jgi:hypothetical protein